jgi:hypothetical protein
MSSLTVPIPPDLSPACRAEYTVRYTVPVNPLLVLLDLLLSVDGRVGIGVGVRDRPVGPTA